MKPAARSPAEAAADWIARRDLGLSPAEEREFQAWLAAAPAHAQAWRETEASWLAFDHAQNLGYADVMVRELKLRQQRRQWRRRFAAITALAAAAVVIFAFALGRDRSAPGPAEIAGAVIHPPERRTLADGSVVELKRGAEIAVAFTPARRDVRLLRGTAYFSVAKNPARPFVVASGQVEVRAVGTAFAVQADAGDVDVLVTEGRVAVSRVSAASESAQEGALTLGVGDRLLVPAGQVAFDTLQVHLMAPAEMEQRLSWRGTWIEFTGTRLKDAIALLNRESRTQLFLDDPALEDMRLSGAFRADNAEGFVRLLVTDYNVIAEPRDSHEIVLRGK